MINNKMMRQVKEIILTLIFSLFYIFLVARFSVLLLGLLPIPFILLGVRNGMKTNILGMVLFFTLLNISFNLAFALTALGLIAPASLLCQAMIEKNYRASQAIVGLGLVFIISIFSLLYVEKLDTGVDLVVEMEAAFDSMLELQKENLTSSGMSQLEVERAADLMGTSFSYLVTVSPMIICFFCLILAYINYKLSCYLIYKTYNKNQSLPKFSRFCLPRNFILGVAVMFIASYGATKMKLAYSGALSQNLSFLVSGLFLVQGFALLDYFLDKLRINKILKAILMFLNILMMPIGGILIILGFMDSFFDFRKLRKKA